MSMLNDITGRNWRVIVADVLDGLRSLPDESVQCCVTSPPYWGLRAYGTDPQVWGGDPACDHQWQEVVVRNENASGGPSTKQESNSGSRHVDYSDRTKISNTCLECGAWRGELGSEPTIDLFVANIVAVFREVRRVLRADGVCFVNLGDSYASGKGTCFNPGGGETSLGKDRKAAEVHPLNRGNKSTLSEMGLKPKDLCGVPWRVAFALQADGWYLRQDIIWHKRSPMPESVTDRCTKAHEYIFLLTKSARYFWDADAVKEAALNTCTGRTVGEKAKSRDQGTDLANADFKSKINGIGLSTRNLRSVWTLSSEGFSEAHFATFPSEIPRRCIKAGTSEKGCCQTCGAPWTRITEKTAMKIDRSKRTHEKGRTRTSGTMVEPPKTKTTGWQQSCECEPAAPVPCTVLDPFSGSGTTGMVATELGRRYVGIELNPNYAEMSRKRIESWKHRDVEKAVKPLAGQLTLLE